MYRTAICWVFMITLNFAPIALFAGPAQEAAVGRTVSDEQQLKEDIKREVMEELLEGDFLREQIELGVKDYLQKEQEAKLAAAAEAMRLAKEKIRGVRPVSVDRDHIYGNPDAAISLIEYSDYECPFCKRFHSTPKEIVDASEGQVNWVYRHLPLGIHNPGAQKQAEAAECASALGGNDAFWQFTDAIYLRTRSNGRGFPLTQLTPLATEIGLETEAFQECLDSSRYAARVQEDMLEGAKLGVTGTPTSILLHNQSGEARLQVGAKAGSIFEADIEAMLK